jgi:hydrogenase/urease accessory protein HupE
MKRLSYLIIAIAALSVAPARAHEIGRTQVNVTIPGDGTYQLDITVDPDALLTKLEVYGGERLSGRLTRTDRDRKISALGTVFLRNVIVRFDGTAAAPRFEYLPASAFSDFAEAPSLVRLTGAVPPLASTLDFANQMAMGSYALNLRIRDSQIQTFWLEGASSSGPISITTPPPPATWDQVAWQYLALGYTHILPKGLDHILFVLGIFLLSARWRSVLLQVSTFTIAHSITLGLTMYGVVSLPARVVEPMIALSIAYVALENLFTSELRSWRVALVFSFGLLHGMGFAGVLKDLGLPRSQFLTALVTFNLGVEAGQLSVIALAFLVVAYWRANRVTYRRFIVQPASLMMALTGLYWTVERIFP